MNATDEKTNEAKVEGFRRWTDPSTGEEYVLIPAQHYQKIKAIIDGLTRRAGWDDPELDVYEQDRKPK